MSSLELNQKLMELGVRLSGKNAPKSKKAEWLDIEETLHEATFHVSGRLFSLLCSWVKVHGEQVITHKLMYLQKEKFSPWLVALAIYAANNKLHVWKGLIEETGQEYAVSELKIAKQAISFKGEETGFRDYGFLIPKGSLRIRENDIFTVKELAKSNRQYKNRLIYGANRRADIITAIELGCKNPFQVSKKVGCNYATAHKVFNNYKIASAT